MNLTAMQKRSLERTLRDKAGMTKREACAFVSRATRGRGPEPETDRKEQLTEILECLKDV